MLNRKTFAPLPAVCMVVLLAILVTGLTSTQVAGQAHCPTHIQGLAHAQGPGYCCGPPCPPNFRYWGYWPTVWRQWPQRRPDIWFPQDPNLEQLPTPEGNIPEPLPKEEPFISPTAPQPGGGFLPPVGEGPATGPGDPGMPFQLDPGFDQGSGFDQGLPGMENLPTQGPAPETMPIEGTEPLEDAGNTDAESPSLPPPAATPAEAPPTTYTPPAAAMPAPSTSTTVPDSSVLTMRQQPVVESNGTLAAEEPAAEPSNPVVPRPEEAQSAASQPAVGEPLAETKQSAFEPVRQTTFESPAEPWAVPKSWKSRRTHTDNPMPETTDGRIGELQQPQPRQSIHEPADALAAAPQPEGLKEPHAVSVGLEGYCPVDLVRNESWTLGDSRFTVEFEGRAYLMCGPEQHRAFRSNPQRYAPANGGFDAVLCFEENNRQNGRTDACAVFEGRLYMFAGADTLARFQENPRRYTRALQRPRD